MQRLLVLLLAAFDAVIAVAVGVAVALAPLTLLWVVGIGDPQWDALWPAAGTVWQFGHLVPLTITLPGEYLALTGIAPDAASFVLSLSPLAFAAFTAIFAARSGARAARAGAWLTGVGAGTVVVAVLAGAVAVTTGNAIAAVELWQAIGFPALVFAVPGVIGAVVTAWSEGDGGLVDRVHDRVDALPGEWGAAPGLIARGGAIAVTGLIGSGALALGVGIALRGGEVIALFETGNVDGMGATVITLAQLAYLPTLVTWALAFLAGPGFALGAGTAVGPAGTQLGIVPAIPVLGALPEATSPWLLALVLLPAAVGGLAGWAARGRITTVSERADAAAAVPVHPALVGLIPERTLPEAPAVAATPPARPLGLLLAVAVGIAAVAAAATAVLAAVASGSLGPGRLSAAGPATGPVALAVGLEVLTGAAIVLLTTRRARRPPKPKKSKAAARKASTRDDLPTGDGELEPSVDSAVLTDRALQRLGVASGDLLDDLRARMADDRPGEGHPTSETPRLGRNSSDAAAEPGPDDTDTAPIPLPDPATVARTVDLPDPATLGARRPTALPPID